MNLHSRPPVTAPSDTQQRDRSLTAQGETPEVLAAALQYAVRAPSGHNTQPWRFRLTGDRVEVHADRSRALPVVDPHDRALIISCGAAVAFLIVAMRHPGFTADVALLPDAAEADLLAIVRRGRCHTPTDRDHQLFDAIDRRHTHRAPFESRAVPEELLTALRADADRFSATLHTVVDDQIKQQIAELVAEGDRAQMADPRFRTELASWVRTNYTRRHDGMPGYAFGMPGLPSLIGLYFMRAIDMGDRQGTKDARLATTAPALLLLATACDTQADWLSAGQALGTLLLTATAAGVAASFLNQPIETRLRAPLGQLLDTAGDSPQLLLRLGYPQESVRPTPRRPVAEVLLPPRNSIGTRRSS